MSTGECVQSESALAGGTNNVWCFFNWIECCFVYKSVCLSYVVLLFYLLLPESENKVPCSKVSSKTNVSVVRFDLELTCGSYRTVWDRENMSKLEPKGVNVYYEANKRALFDRRVV